MTVRKKTRKKTNKAAAGKRATASKPRVLQLAKQCNIQGVADLKLKLAASLTPGKPVGIDAGEVESVDTAALQLLVAFRRHSEAQSSTVSWVNTSAAFADAARLLDLDQHLGLEPAAA